MSIEETEVIDFIGIDKEQGEVSLTISDHLEWDDNHLFILQKKLNSYISFIESGELFEIYLDSKNRNISIVIMCKHSPSPAGMNFIEKAKLILEKINARLIFQIFDIDSNE